jgi:hypothetical protein
MTKSKEYQESDAFRRKLLREIKAGNQLLKKGWSDNSTRFRWYRNAPNLPADVYTLETVIGWYDIFLKTHDWVSK